jgi:enoyl-CoA hydratase/carnithine racemase
VVAQHGWIPGLNNAIGGGWGLALAGEFQPAVPGARFWLLEVDLGVPLGIGTTSLLVSTVGTARAKDILITGSPATGTAPRSCAPGV